MVRKTVKILNKQQQIRSKMILLVRFIQDLKNIFLPGSKPSTFISFSTFYPSFPIYHPILALCFSLLLSFHFLPSFLLFLFPFLPILFRFFFLGNESISATFLVAPLPHYFVFEPWIHNIYNIYYISACEI